MKDTPEKHHMTLMLKQWQAGDLLAFDQLVPHIYQELRRLAKAQLQRGQNSIQCTELISEAYLRLIDIHSVNWQDRSHFYSMAARTMRRVLVDRFRQKNTDKRGNNPTLLTFQEGESKPQITLQLDLLEDALVQLEHFDASLAEIVTLKFYGGLSHQEIADISQSSERSVRRNWSMARLWLKRELSQ